MERLTFRDGKGKAWAKLRRDAPSEQVLEYGRKSLERLANYEDTGLTSSDIVDLKNEHCLLCGKYKEAHNGACDGCRWRDKT